MADRSTGRLFIALALPASVKAGLAALQEALRPAVPKASWPRGEGMHLTLQFLGEVALSRASSIAGAMEAAAASHGPFEASLGVLGAFPSRRRARVVWIGVEKGQEEVVALQSDLSSRLREIGFACEDRSFHPHITLARVKGRPPGDLGRTLERTGKGAEAVWSIDALHLVRSHLEPRGARYETLSSATLKRPRIGSAEPEPGSREPEARDEDG